MQQRLAHCQSSLGWLEGLGEQKEQEKTAHGRALAQPEAAPRVGYEVDASDPWCELLFHCCRCCLPQVKILWKNGVLENWVFRHHHCWLEMMIHLAW